MQADPLRKKNSEEKNSEKKCLAVPKKMKGSLVSPGMVCYAEKQEKPFWFSSLDQIVHFDAIIFCRTFVELFWSVRVDRKKKSHYNSRVSLHEAPTKNSVEATSALTEKVSRLPFSNKKTEFVGSFNPFLEHLPHT